MIVRRELRASSSRRSLNRGRYGQIVLRFTGNGTRLSFVAIERGRIWAVYIRASLGVDMRLNGMLGCTLRILCIQYAYVHRSAIR